MERDLRQYGGVSYISPLMIVEPEEAPEPVKPLLNLICTRFDAKSKKDCGGAWQAETFTPCPKCGGKQFVKKTAAPPPEPAVAEAGESSPLEAV